MQKIELAGEERSQERPKDKVQANECWRARLILPGEPQGFWRVQFMREPVCVCELLTCVCLWNLTDRQRCPASEHIWTHPHASSESLDIVPCSNVARNVCRWRWPPCSMPSPTLNNLMDRDILPPACHHDASFSTWIGSLITDPTTFYTYFVHLISVRM